MRPHFAQGEIKTHPMPPCRIDSVDSMPGRLFCTSWNADVDVVCVSGVSGDWHSVYIAQKQDNDFEKVLGMCGTAALTESKFKGLLYIVAIPGNKWKKTEPIELSLAKDGKYSKQEKRLIKSCTAYTARKLAEAFGAV